MISKEDRQAIRIWMKTHVLYLLVFAIVFFIFLILPAVIYERTITKNIKGLTCISENQNQNN